MAAPKTERREAVPTVENLSKQRDELALGFARDFGKRGDNMLAKVIARLSADRLASLGVRAGLTPEQQSKVLDRLPDLSDLQVSLHYDNGTPRDFGPDGLVVKLPGLKEFDQRWRPALLYEYLRIFLLKKLSNENIGNFMVTLKPEIIFSLLNNFRYNQSKKPSLDDLGRYSRDYDINQVRRDQERKNVMQADKELFIDLLIALAAREESTGRNLQQIWNKMLSGSNSALPDKEVGCSILVTHDDSDYPGVDGLPFRFENKDNDINAARLRLNLEAQLKTQEVIERTARSREEAASGDPDKEYDPKMLEHLKEQRIKEKKEYQVKAEMLKTLIRGNLERISSFRKLIDSTGVNDVPHLVETVKNIFFVELGGVFEKALAGKIYLKDSDGTDESTPVEFMRLQSRLQFAVNLIKDLSRKVHAVNRAKGNSDISRAVKDLKSAALNTLDELHNNFSEVNNEE